MPGEDDVRKTIDTYLETLEEVSPKEREIAFYGGSFTGIPSSLQEKYLGIAKEYMDRGSVSSIHLSTRPDYIDEDVLSCLKTYGVKTIELGVQSFDDRVLALSKRGHDSASVYKALEMIRAWGFDLGIQLMIGLPGDSMESCLFSAKEAAILKPKVARLYPTVVLENTELYQMYLKGDFVPLDRDEALSRTATMYRVLREAGILIMRVGLKSTDIINSRALGEINRGTYHPAFRQLVESEIAREDIESLIEKIYEDRTPPCLIIASNPLWVSAAAGHNGINREYFREKYPGMELNFLSDEKISPGEFKIYETNGGMHL